jgi:histidine triad (HIT) family protein
MHDANCIFCKIVRGEIPAAKVWEDDAVLCFLDIGPLAPGHLLVIPKTHHAELSRMPAETCARLMQAVPRLGQALLAVTGAAGFNVLVNQGRAAGQEVFHVHVHVIPRAADDGLGYRWNAGKYPPDAIEEWRRRYCDAL